MLNYQPCLNPYQMPDDQLRNELRVQGKATTGTRAELVERFLARENRCMTMSLGISEEMACHVDQQCMGIECCLGVKLFMFRKNYRFYTRYDPCTMELVVGINDSYETRLGPSLDMDDIYGGFKDLTLETGLVETSLNAELMLRMSLEKSDTQITLTASAGFCRQNDVAGINCLLFLPILDKAIMPLPVCGPAPDRTLTFREVNLKSELRNMKDKFSENSRTTFSSLVETVVAEAANLVPCMSTDVNSGARLPCPRPDRMTEANLLAALEARNLSTSGTKNQMVARLEQADRQCTSSNGTIYTIPYESNSTFVNDVYMTVSDDCLSFEACVDFTYRNFSMSVRSSLTLDSCTPLLTVGFQECTQEMVLFDNNLDTSGQLKLSNYFVINYDFLQNLTTNEYIMDVNLKIQVDPTGSPVVDTTVAQALRLPIPTCNADAYELPSSVGSFSRLATQFGGSLKSDMVDYLFKMLHLDNVLTDTCTLGNATEFLHVGEILAHPGLLHATSHGRLPGMYTRNGSLRQQLSYDFLQNLTTNEYIMDVNLKIQVDPNGSPVVDTTVAQALRLPIPTCNADAYELPSSVGSFSRLATQFGGSLKSDMVDYLFKMLHLDVRDLVHRLHRNCPYNVSVTPLLPADYQDKVTCITPTSCDGITCCMEWSMTLPDVPSDVLKQVPFEFNFDPCNNMRLRVRFGGYQHVENLLDYEFGTEKTLNIGIGENSTDPSPVVIRYKVSRLFQTNPYDEAFLVKASLSLAIPVDGVQYSFPAGGLTLLDNMRLEVCPAANTSDLADYANVYKVSRLFQTNPYDEAFLVKASLSLTIPVDGVQYSFPAGGLTLLDNMRLEVCPAANTSDLAAFNLTSYTEALGENPNDPLTPGTAQMILNHFGLTPFLKKSQCDITKDPYIPNLRGWRDDCDSSLFNLPSSLGDHAVCHMSSSCTRVDCCFHSPLLGISVNAFFDLNVCDYYITGGVENRVYGRQYLLNQTEDIDWTLGVNGTFEISNAIFLEYKVRKQDPNFLLDVSLNLCLGDTCQYSVDVYRDTRVPQLNCESGNTQALQGCPSPLSGNTSQTCVLTNQCKTVQCCLPADLVVAHKDLEFTFVSDVCADSFTFTFEQKSWTRTLSGIAGVTWAKVPIQERIGEAITLNLGLQKTISGLNVDATMELCTTVQSSISCTNHTLLDDAHLYDPQSNCGVGKRRRRRSAGTQTRDQQMLSLINNGASTNQIQAYFTQLEDAEEIRCSDLRAAASSTENINNPKAILEAMGDHNPRYLLTCNDDSIVNQNIEG
ncbi:CCAAT/enhancer-binding protein zeta, partial [Plakobranchus ocellatus]